MRGEGGEISEKEGSRECEGGGGGRERSDSICQADV